MPYANDGVLGNKIATSVQKRFRAPSGGPPSPATETDECQEIDTIIREAHCDNANYRRI